MNENHMTKIENEERYVIAPKGIATLALLECGLVDSISDPRINGFWCIFEQGMMKGGYIVTDEEKEQ